MHKSKITMTTIAKEAGVSVSTVSRVLNDDTSISPVIRKKVKDLASKLYYEKTRRRIKNSRVAGLIVPNVLNPFFPLLTKGIESVAKVQRFNIMLCDSEDSVEEESENIQRLVDFDVNGMIVVPSGGRSEKIQELLSIGFPLVVLDRAIDEDKACMVTADNLDGAFQAVKYLINIGHRKILHLAGPPNLTTAADRLQGYRSALEQAGMDYDERLVVKGNFDFVRAYEEIRQVLQGSLHFTAIFSANDSMAFGAFQALKEAGVAVPEQVSIVGYDDVSFASVLGLTTVAQPIYEMGRNAMFMLLDLINQRIVPPQQVVLRPSMVIRSTCHRIT